MKRFIPVFAVLLLAGCANNVGSGQPVAQMTFAHLQPIPINVNAINVQIEEARTGGEFVTDPVVAAENYFKSRYVPQGAQDQMLITIEEATVRRGQKKASGKMAQFFDVGGQDVYNVNLRLRVEHVDAQSNRLYGKVFKAWREMNITEHASVAERERHELAGLEKMFNDLDREIAHMVVEDMHLKM